MEEIKLLIQGMKTDIDSKFMAMESQLSQMEDKISNKVNTHMNKKFEDLNRDLQDLRSRLDNQEKRLYNLEKVSVERNLVFFGVIENEKSYFDLLNAMIHIIDQKIGVPVQASEIQSVKRLGKKNSKPRPVSVVLTTLGSKINILKNKKRLDGTGIYVSQEFPVPILEKRRMLKAQLKTEIEKGNVAYLNYDKLIIKEKPTDTSHKKRQLSVSPIQPSNKTASQKNDPTIAQSYSNWKNNRTPQNTAKKHRTHQNTMHAYVQHSNDE
ncbi:protein unc-13 homolog C-like [Maniola jurtina]|uniref:protein unc-13 homolog C-like n=1 Tax=Maniola jurtina TaxID=191418 RepID=UPI001E68D90D|nr:protein unc-13 homolog C-like [Maniola jurtina]